MCEGLDSTFHEQGANDKMALGNWSKLQPLGMKLCRAQWIFPPDGEGGYSQFLQPPDAWWLVLNKNLEMIFDLINQSN